MTSEQLNKALGLMAEEYRLKRNSLLEKYVFANNPYKVGDIFTDHIGSIKIEGISAKAIFGTIPSCVYFGVELTKKLEPKKSGKRRNAYQTDEKKEIRNG